MLVIGVLLLVFVGPDDLPKLMRTVGKFYAKARRASDDLRRAFNAEVARVDADDRRADMEKRKAALEKHRLEGIALRAAEKAALASTLPDAADQDNAQAPAPVLQGEAFENGMPPAPLEDISEQPNLPDAERPPQPRQFAARPPPPDAVPRPEKK